MQGDATSNFFLHQIHLAADECGAKNSRIGHFASFQLLGRLVFLQENQTWRKLFIFVKLDFSCKITKRPRSGKLEVLVFNHFFLQNYVGPVNYNTRRNRFWHFCCVEFTQEITIENANGSLYWKFSIWCTKNIHPSNASSFPLHFSVVWWVENSKKMLNYLPTYPSLHLFDESHFSHRIETFGQHLFIIRTGLLSVAIQEKKKIRQQDVMYLLRIILLVQCQWKGQFITVYCVHGTNVSYARYTQHLVSPTDGQSAFFFYCWWTIAGCFQGLFCWNKFAKIWVNLRGEFCWIFANLIQQNGHWSQLNASIQRWRAHSIYRTRECVCYSVFSYDCKCVSSIVKSKKIILKTVE